MISRGFIQRLFLVGILISAVLLLTILVFRYPTRNVPILRAPVAFGVTITAPMLSEINWPENAIYNGMATRADELVGKTSLVAMPANAPINVAMVGDAEVSTDPRYPGAKLADKNRLKVFVPTDLIRSSGGTIVTGDLVDVVWRDAENRTAVPILQKARVLAGRTTVGLDVALSLKSVTTGSGGPANKALAAAGYILALDPANALILLGYPSEQLVLLPVDPCAPLITGVPVAVDESELDCGAQTEPASDAP